MVGLVTAYIDIVRVWGGANRCEGRRILGTLGSKHVQDSPHPRLRAGWPSASGVPGIYGAVGVVGPRVSTVGVARDRCMAAKRSAVRIRHLKRQWGEGLS